MRIYGIYSDLYIGICRDFMGFHNIYLTFPFFRDHSVTKPVQLILGCGLVLSTWPSAFEAQHHAFPGVIGIMVDFYGDLTDLISVQNGIITGFHGFMMGSSTIIGFCYSITMA